MALFCSSRSPSTSRVSTVRTSIRQRAACGTAAKRTRRRSRRRRWRMNSRAWWDASTSPGPVSPLRPPTRTTATVRQPQAVVEGRITLGLLFLWEPQSSSTCVKRLSLCCEPGAPKLLGFVRQSWNPMERFGPEEHLKGLWYQESKMGLRILPKAPYVLQIAMPYELATRYHSVTGVHFTAVLFRKR